MMNGRWRQCAAARAAQQLIKGRQPCQQQRCCDSSSRAAVLPAAAKDAAAAVAGNVVWSCQCAIAAAAATSSPCCFVSSGRSRRTAMMTQPSCTVWQRKHAFALGAAATAKATCGQARGWAVVLLHSVSSSSMERPSLRQVPAAGGYFQP